MLVLAAVAAGCAAAPPPAPQQRTVQAGGLGPGRVFKWTCGPEQQVCTETIGVESTVQKPVTVPVGTTVRVEVGGRGMMPARCWIADESGQMTLEQQEDPSLARCEYRVE